MKSRKASSSTNVKWNRTGTPKILTEPTLPALGRSFDLSPLVTQAFDAGECAAVPRMATQAVAPAAVANTALAIALRCRSTFRYFHRAFLYFQANFNFCIVIIRERWCKWRASVSPGTSTGKLCSSNGGAENE